MIHSDEILVQHAASQGRQWCVSQTSTQQPRHILHRYTYLLRHLGNTTVNIVAKYGSDAPISWDADVLGRTTVFSLRGPVSYLRIHGHRIYTS